MMNPISSTPARTVVAVIGTGGTISTEGRHTLDFYEYSDLGHRLQVDELLARFPETAQVAEVLPVRFRAIGSSSITPRDWVALGQKIEEVAREREDLSGIVVTHGTASLEETAYFLHLTSITSVPIVLVGSQRPPNALSTDAGLNLVNAIAAAVEPGLRGLGVLVVLNGEVHSAREVSKTSNWRLDTFRAPDFGPLGYLDANGSVSIYRRPTRRHTPDTEFKLPDLTALPRVEILYSYAGADGALIEAAVAAGARAIVIAGNGPGRPTALQRKALENVSRQGVLVVLSSRTGSGTTIYRHSDEDAGFVTADNLNPQKARILTMLALTKTSDRDEIRRMFREY